MSTIKSSAENLTLNADGSGNDIIFQSNGSNVATLDQAGLLTATTFAGSGASLTALPAAQVSGTHTSFTSTGIDDNATSTAITIDASENVGIGVTPETWETGWTGLQVGGLGAAYASTSASAGSEIALSLNTYINSSGQTSYIITDEASRYRQDSGEHYLQVAVSGSADAAITWVDGVVIKPNGGGGASTADISMGSKWNGDGGGKTDFQTGSNNGVLCRMSSSTTGSNQRMWFVNSNGLVGSVSTNGSATVFATSSDYRLKENVNYDWDATTKLKQLKPARFNFIADDTTVIDGFIAHEVQEVVPEAVTGTKDEMRDEEYEVTPAVMDGETVVTPAVMGTRSVPYYQGIDQAKLVPLLVKTIQEMEARITALEG
jgi:hypothetical protein